MIIEFKIQSKKNKNITLKGFANYDELDDDDSIQWYDERGFENGPHIPNNPYNPNNEEDYVLHMQYEQLINAYSLDMMFTQFLSDFAEEVKTIDRGGYLLHINWR